MSIESDNYELRMMLFMSHSHNGSSACLYGDDGERVCNACGVDFVRDSVQMIKDKTYTYNINELVRLGIIKMEDQLTTATNLRYNERS